MDLPALKNLWRRADCVCFDVDSTLITNEAIDDLAEYVGVGKQVQEMTLNAMNGNVSFREALSNRLNIIKPTAQNVDDYNKIQEGFITPGAKELVALLLERGVAVYLVSGGFRQVINPLADLFSIPHSNVYANTLFFKQETGEYNGFDENELTSASGGKARVVQLLKDKHGYKNIVTIGDGATDLETCPPADGFIGFGGNIVRDSVKKNSIWFAYGFDELINELKE